MFPRKIVFYHNNTLTVENPINNKILYLATFELDLYLFVLFCHCRNPVTTPGVP